MKPVTAVIAQGQMGAGVGRRLSENGIEVRTLIAGRSAESQARAAAAGMAAADEDGIAACDLILSIVPPGEALSLAERLRPALQRANRTPVYVDCNAISPATVRAVAEVVDATGAPCVDAGIIGGPPKAGGPDQPEAKILEGAAELYERIAADFESGKSETGALSDFVELLKQR